jgi:hypothetical protein
MKGVPVRHLCCRRPIVYITIDTSSQSLRTRLYMSCAHVRGDTTLPPRGAYTATSPTGGVSQAARAGAAVKQAPRSSRRRGRAGAAVEQAPPLRWSCAVHEVVAAKHLEEAVPPELHSNAPAAQATHDQLSAVLRKLKKGKAAGPSGLPYEHVRVAATSSRSTMSAAAPHQRHAARRASAGATAAR